MDFRFFPLVASVLITRIVILGGDLAQGWKRGYPSGCVLMFYSLQWARLGVGEEEVVTVVGFHERSLDESLRRFHGDRGVSGGRALCGSLRRVLSGRGVGGDRALGEGLRRCR